MPSPNLSYESFPIRGLFTIKKNSILKDTCTDIEILFWVYGGRSVVLEILDREQIKQI